jgi:hypothetical protein
VITETVAVLADRQCDAIEDVTRPLHVELVERKIANAELRLSFTELPEQLSAGSGHRSACAAAAWQPRELIVAASLATSTSCGFPAAVPIKIKNLGFQLSSHHKKVAVVVRHVLADPCTAASAVVGHTS